MKKQGFLYGVMFGLGLFMLLGAADYKKFQHRDASNRSVKYFDNTASGIYMTNNGVDKAYNIPFKGHRLVWTYMCTGAWSAFREQELPLIIDYEDGTRDTLYTFQVDLDSGWGQVELYTSKAIDSLFTLQETGGVFYWVVQGNE